MNFICANFQPNRRTFFDHEISEIFNFQIRFSSDKKSKIGMFQIIKQLYPMNFLYANFQPNRRTFFWREGGRELTMNFICEIYDKFLRTFLRSVGREVAHYKTSHSTCKTSSGGIPTHHVQDQPGWKFIKEILRNICKKILSLSNVMSCKRISSFFHFVKIFPFFFQK